MTTSKIRYLVSGALLTLLVGFAATPAAAAVRTVCLSGCDHTTIQAAAVAADPSDSIQVLSLSPHTEGEIFLTKDLTIDGFGAGTTIIQADPSQGAATVPVFVVANGAEVAMNGLTIRHGGGDDGGGVAVLDGILSLDNVVVSLNDATGDGGGIYVAAAGSVEMVGTTIVQNTALGTGGGVHVAEGGSLVTIGSVIDQNSTAAGGGGVCAAGSVAMSGTDVKNNFVDAIYSGGGGGILSAGPLTLHDCELRGNNVVTISSHLDPSRGGGLYYQGPSLLVEDTTITLNVVSSSSSQGGGLFLKGPGTAVLRGSTVSSNTGSNAAGVYSDIVSLTVEDCTIADNTANSTAGGLMLIVETEDTSILHSTISGNHAIIAGGLGVVTLYGRVIIANSTVSGNSADDVGGGIIVSGDGLELASTTVTDNTADADADGFGNAGGIFVDDGYQAELRNTIIADNHDLSPTPSPIIADCSGTLWSQGYNLIRSLGWPIAACTITGDLTGNLIGQDPVLEALADNGGPTRTHALGRSSPADDGGNPAGCTDPDGELLDTDQRHGLRQDRCDIGAFEEGADFGLLFEDGFESGDTLLWSATPP